MKIEELYLVKTNDRRMKFRMYFQKLFQPIMHVDFISKDGVAYHKTQRIM